MVEATTPVTPSRLLFLLKFSGGDISSDGIFGDGSSSELRLRVDLLALSFVLVLAVDGMLDDGAKWQIKCSRAFSDVDGSGSGVGFSEAALKLLVLHGSSGDVRRARPMRLVCSFLVKDGGLDFPSAGLLSWLLLDAAVVDFWVVDSVGGAGFFLFQGHDDDGRRATEETRLAAIKCWRSRRAFWLSFSPACRAASLIPPELEVVRRTGAWRQDPRTLVSSLLFIRVLYALRHLWRMDVVDLAVICTSSRVMSVRACLFFN
ncbi:hypothetical protein PVAP13_8NG151201 [Panicum virgatum]|uniref:Uncharacterized protein n=1 Tax=Panicum virgatum TaxID=38727 RepID=A0A8T0P8S9_PANVG|nr:hypothetical protein PVAP13_8NG151201 [Panicum virgatum]